MCLMAAAPENVEPPDVGEVIRVSEGRYAASPTVIPGTRINPKRDTPLEWVSSFQVSGQPVFWYSKSKGAPVVDERVSTGFSQVQLATLTVGESRELGQLRKQVDPVALAVALIRTELVMTYVHIEATMAIAKVNQTKDGVEVFFRGEHVYYTNEENRDPLAFVIRVDDQGRVTVRNGP